MAGTAGREVDHSCVEAQPLLRHLDGDNRLREVHPIAGVSNIYLSVGWNLVKSSLARACRRGELI